MYAYTLHACPQGKRETCSLIHTSCIPVGLECVKSQQSRKPFQLTFLPRPPFPIVYNHTYTQIHVCIYTEHTHLPSARVNTFPHTYIHSHIHTHTHISAYHHTRHSSRKSKVGTHVESTTLQRHARREHHTWHSSRVSTLTHTYTYTYFHITPHSTLKSRVESTFVVQCSRWGFATQQRQEESEQTDEERSRESSHTHISPRCWVVLQRRTLRAREAIFLSCLRE